MPSYRNWFCSAAFPLNRTLSKAPSPVLVAPGAVRANREYVRPFTGRSCTSRAVTLDPIRAELVSMVAPALSVT